MGPSSALAAEDDPLRLLMTDLEAPPPCDLDLAATFGFSAASAGSGAFVAGGAAVAGGGAAAAAGGAAALVGSESARWLAVCLFELAFPKPARAAPAAEELIGADIDNTDFLSDAGLLRLG